MKPGYKSPDPRMGIQDLLDRSAKCKYSNQRAPLTKSIKTIRENVLREYLASILDF